MSGGRLELASIPGVYNVRHQPPRLKRSRLDSLYEECVVRVAGWDGHEAPVVATLSPGIIDHDAGMWNIDYPDIPIEQGLAPIVYRAARGADGTVRLVTPVAGHAFMNLQRRGQAEHGILANMSVLKQMRYPGSIRASSPQPAHAVEIGHTISSERAAGMEYARTMAQSMVLIDGQLHMQCGEPGWKKEETYRLPTARCYATNHPTDGGPQSWSTFAPYGMSPAMSKAMLVAKRPLDPVKNGTIDVVVAAILGQDPCWSMVQILVQNALKDQPDVIVGMSEDELVLRARMARIVRDWPSARDGNIVDMASRLVRVVYCIMPNHHADTMSRMLLVEAEMARTPGTPNLEGRLGAAGIEIAAAAQDHADSPLPGPGVR